MGYVFDPQPKPQTEGFRHRIEYDDDIEEKKPKSKYFKVMCTLALSGTLLGGLSAFEIYQDYKKSLDWSTNRDSLKMAEMPVDILTDTSAQAHAKENFLALYMKALDKNGQIHVSKDDMVKLKMALNKITSSKELYQDKYNKVETKYNIRVQLDKLFSKKGALKENVTPKKVRDTLREVSPQLNSIFQKNNHDEFVKSELPTVKNLVKDTNTITNTTNRITQIMTINKGVLKPIASLTPKQYEGIYNNLNKLHYRWEYLNKFVDLQDLINNVLEKQLSKINAYNDYTADVKNKEEMYQKLTRASEKHRRDYIKKQEEKRREKEQAREEELENRRREKEEQARQEKETEDMLKGSSNSDGSSNSSSDDSKSSEENHGTTESPRSSRSNSSNSSTRESSSSSQNNSNYSVPRRNYSTNSSATQSVPRTNNSNNSVKNNNKQNNSQTSMGQAVEKSSDEE